MTQDEIIRMARECGGIADDQTIVLYHEELERFAALVAAHEREKQVEQEPVAWFVQYKNRHGLVFGSKPKFIVDGVVEPLYAAPVSIEAAVLAEREECAKVCDEEYARFEHPWNGANKCAAVIRARGEK